MEYVTIKDDTALMAVEGKLTFFCCKKLDSELNTAFQNGCTKVTVDFKDTNIIDSAAIRLLCDTQKKVRSENFSACNASGKVLTTLRSSGLDSWLKK